MRTGARAVAFMGGTVLTLLVLGGGDARGLGAKEKAPQLSPDDPTLRLFNLLDSRYNGKLEDYYVLADVVNDPKNPGQPQQHVLRLDYNKGRGFGKLYIYVRMVGQVTPEQLKAYTPKQIFDFGETDAAKFTKTDPGPFGGQGDVYFEPASEGGPMKEFPITPDVQAEYGRFVTQYLLPALEKKTEGGNGS